mmetsp:Transcript_10399/g.13931  ORF Transcript_10399/g.13931 Transcript_10399/m.13931 type:complete len:137 (+) Transcript_10399:730-1140(+)
MVNRQPPPFSVLIMAHLCHQSAVRNTCLFTGVRRQINTPKHVTLAISASRSEERMGLLDSVFPTAFPVDVLAPVMYMERLPHSHRARTLTLLNLRYTDFQFNKKKISCWSHLQGTATANKKADACDEPTLGNATGG